MKREERAMLLRAARESILSHLEKRAPGYEEPAVELLQPSAVFVTLHKNGNLRGCIGTLEATMPLLEAVKDYAISSAFRDPRFPQLTLEEYPDLRVEISVLSPLEKVRSIDEIEVGRHGLYVKRGMRSGVLLPQVPVEQGWNREQFLENTCRKAGLPPDAWLEDDVVFYLFTAEVFGEKE
ncbi:MAG: AmmeMemoRadiSam system protein A [Spirochaetales bacterium]|nr:AmmeMemoRadiSam system protein A [Spirochaetales bacterium]